MSLATQEHVIEEMFLSPRVVNAATFEELAGALRTLVRDAVDQQSRFAGSVDQARSHQSEIDSTLAKLDAGLAPAARMVRTLDDRLQRAAEASSRLADPEAMLGPAITAITQAAAQRCDQAIAERSRAAEARAAAFGQECTGLVDAQMDRLEMMVAQLEERAARAEQRLISAEQSLSRGVQAAEASAEALIAAGAKAKVQEVLTGAVDSVLEPMVQQAQARIEHSSQACLESLALATAKTQRLDAECNAASTRFEAAVQEARERLSVTVGEAVDQVSAQVSTIIASLPSLLKNHQAEADRISQVAHASLVGRLNETGEESSRCCERVEDSLTGLEARAGSIADRLARRIDDLAADADKVAQEARRLSSSEDTNPEPIATEPVKPAEAKLAETKPQPPAREKPRTKPVRTKVATTKAATKKAG